LKRTRVSPGVRILSRLLEIVYLTSLKSEEGQPLQLRIFLVNSESPDVRKNASRFPEGWRIVKLASALPFTVPIVAKLAKAADPWSSGLTVYFDSKGDFFIWGLVDQVVHFNTMLVHESDATAGPPQLG